MPSPTVFERLAVFSAFARRQAMAQAIRDAFVPSKTPKEAANAIDTLRASVVALQRQCEELTRELRTSTEAVAQEARALKEALAAATLRESQLRAVLRTD